MKNRFRLISRGDRGGAYYWVDKVTGKRGSLGACDLEEAEEVVKAKNQATRQPALNLHLARAYLAGSDSGATTRTWEHVMNEVVQLKEGPTRQRWETAIKDRVFDKIRHCPLIGTQSGWTNTAPRCSRNYPLQKRLLILSSRSCAKRLLSASKSWSSNPLQILKGKRSR